MFSPISLLALFELAALVVCKPVQPTITPQPLARRRPFDDFTLSTLFYTTRASDETSSMWTSWVLPEDVAMVTTQSYAYTCNTSMTSWEEACAATFYTSCEKAKTAWALDDSSVVCPGVCNLDIIYTSDIADNDGLYWAGCNTDSAQAYYGASPTESPTSTPTSTPSSSSTSSPTPTPFNSPSPGSTSNPGPSPTSTPLPLPLQSSTPASTTNQAWIAGPVIGSVAAVGIAGLLFVFLRRRKRNANPAYQPAPQMQGPPAYQVPGMPQPMSPPTSYVDSSTHGYYGEQVAENKPSTLSVYSHTAPGYAPSEGTIQMPVGVGEHHSPQTPTLQASAPQGAGHISELPSGQDTHNLPELSPRR